MSSQVGGVSNFSIELWFKTTASSGTLMSAGTGDFWRVYLENGLAKFDFQTGGLSGNGGSSLTKVNDGNWHHLTAVRDGHRSGKLYLDGVLVSEFTYSGTTNSIEDVSKAFIGRNSQNSGDYFQGEINEVRIWNVALNQQDIQNIKNPRLNGNETGLVNYYKANEGSGTTLIDSTVNKSNGILQGGTSWTKTYSEPSEFITRTFNANNWDQPQTFQVVGINDNIADGDVPYNIITTVTSEDPNYNKLAINPISLTNTEDSDTAKIIITPPGQVVEGNNSRQNVYGVRLNSQPVGEIRVIMTPKVDQFQLNNEDIGEPLTLTFNPSNWNQEQTVRVTAVDDSIVEYFQTSQIEFKVTTGNIKDFESKWNNGTPNQALDLGKITGGIERTGLRIDSTDSTTDVDWYKFTLPTQGTAKDFVEIQFANANGDLNLELYPNSSHLILDGVDDYVEIASSVGGASNFSIELWFKTTASSGTLMSAGTGDFWRVYLENGLAKFDFQTGGLSGNGGSSLTKVNDGNWHHLTAVRDERRSGKLYLDGVLVSEFTYSGTNNSIENVSKAFIGRNSRNSGDYFQGEIGQVRTWNIARTQQEIQEYANKTLNGNETGLIAYYQTKEGKGLTLLDSTSNQNHGTLQNGTSWNPEYTYTYTLGSQQKASLNIIDDDKAGITLSNAVLAQWALKFDGVNDYVEMSSQVGGVSNFSIELWFKTTASSGTLMSAG
ncbi:MAG: LamG domain-containing protein, partial [Sphaerospermopsis kisseleviana]